MKARQQVSSVAEAPDHGQRAGTNDAQCFLCAYGEGACEVASVEGYLHGVVEQYGPRRAPLVMLTEADGGETLIELDRRLRPLARELAALPLPALRHLRLRVYHLHHVALTGGEAPAAIPSPSRRRLRATPYSVAVLEPDLLLNITDINSAEYCVRQYPLRRMVPSPPTAATLRGTLIHQTFKEVLKGGETTAAGVRAHLDRALHHALPDLALRQLSVAEVAADAEPHLRALHAWQMHHRANLWGSEPVLRAETFLLAPEVGLKGRLDFLLHDAHGDTLLELKTGEVRAALPKRDHRWQVHGYQTLLAARRLGERVQGEATLLYSGTPGQAEAYGIPFTLRDLHHVLDLRNALALVHATGAVPPAPPATRCARCSLRQQCARVAPLLGWEPPTLEEESVPPVTETDAADFTRWYELLRLEARAAEEQVRTLWLSTPAERVAAGIALGNLRAEGEPRQTESGEWEYSFHCDQTSELREGDSILLSDGDPVRGAVVSGTILRLEEHHVTVWTPERIARPALIDRYGSDIVHDRTVRNLWRWLDAAPRLRALVRGDRRPEGDAPAAAAFLEELPATFNSEQRQAIARALAARDYLLIQGPPGTGKTSVVAEIVRRAVARGERVLVGAFTNQAVDTVVRRLVEGGMRQVVRLGHDLSVSPDLRPYRLGAQAGAATADEEAALDPTALYETLRRAPVVATTTATWSAERYDEAGEALRFDLAILDEATQLTVPAVLGALRFAKRFVLVGDERQLPPLVVSAEATERGLGRSLFATLLACWGEEASVALRRQYRMHPVICEFPSTQFYDGALLAEGAALTATLALAADSHALHGALADVLDPQHPLVWVDVPPHAATIASPAGKASAEQADVTRMIVRELRAAGVAAAEIGVIAPYRAQVAAIRRRLAASGEAEVTVDTVDRFQGGERSVILYSFGGGAGLDGTPTPPFAHAAGRDFLGDPHRLNVALTRAQHKLILIGNRERLSAVPLVQRLIAHCAELYGGHGGIVVVGRR